MRETMSDEGLEALVASMKALGQLQNLVLVRAGDRYRIAAGHRRSIALERSGIRTARALVFPEGTPLEQAIKVDENAQQERVNPAAEATYYLWLLEHRCAGDVEQLARLVRRKESFVLDRLDLTRGDAEVFAALRAGSISLAIAQELNKVRADNYRRLFLSDAISQGANAATVRRWRQELQRNERIQEAAAAERANPTPPSSESAIVSIDECPLCHSAGDQHEMEYVRVHRSCRAVFARQQAGGAGEDRA
jgi:ParB/RepB/Spo0J family partition protein